MVISYYLTTGSNSSFFCLIGWFIFVPHCVACKQSFICIDLWCPDLYALWQHQQHRHGSESLYISSWWFHVSYYTIPAIDPVHYDSIFYCSCVKVMNVFYLWFRYNVSGTNKLSLDELKVMMEKMGAPQTHLGLKSMIQVPKEGYT